MNAIIGAGLPPLNLGWGPQLERRRGARMSKERLPHSARSQQAETKTVTSTIESQKSKPVSVYLSNKDRHSLEEIASKHKINRHMLLSYCVRYFLANYRAGHIKLDPTIENGKVVLSVNIALKGSVSWSIQAIARIGKPQGGMEVQYPPWSVRLQNWIVLCWV